MYSRFPSLAAACAIALATPPLAAQAADLPELRVCLDPDNLPYSHEDGRGFEVRIAEIVAAEMGAKLRIAWAPLKRGFVRKTLGAGLCDALVGIPAGFERVAATRPYYRSSYVFVSRDAAAPLRSFGDPRLTSLRIGVQLVGDDMEATPPGHALALKGAIDNVVGFPPYGHGAAVERMMAALADGRLDAGVAWGPAAGWFAAQAQPPWPVALAAAPEDFPPIPFEYGISMGVKRGDSALREALEAALERRRSEVDAVLAAYGVPRVDRP
jgi:quinoprotein dehydrogenase-associated probable ABC transporter substrate-binding protein